jgi:hypothetical protein
MSLFSFRDCFLSLCVSFWSIRIKSAILDIIERWVQIDQSYEFRNAEMNK